MRVFLVFVILSLMSKSAFNSLKTDNNSERNDQSLWKYIRQVTENLADKLIRKKHTKLYPEREDKFVAIERLPFQRGTVRESFAINAMISNSNSNIICSPLAALLPLGKLALGASGRSYYELTEAIGVKDKDQLKSIFKDTINRLRILPGASLSLASRMFISNQNEIYSKFKNESIEIFDSAVQPISLLNPFQTCDAINGWISRQTNGTINTLVEPHILSGQMSMILISAIYFKGNWLKSFRKKPHVTFYSSSGTKSVTMLTRQDFYKYVKNDELKSQIVEIPYINGKTSLIVVLPFKRTALTELLELIQDDPQLLWDAIQDLRLQTDHRVILSIPKFKFESVLDLKMLYHSVGVERIFKKEGTGLNGIVVDEEVSVSDAIQKAVIDVHEVGTEAAAGAVMDIAPVALPLNQIIFHADHPFMFVLQSENEQLFAGICNDP